MKIQYQLGVIGVALATVLTFVSPALADEWNKETVFHFNEAVEIPGHVLGPGNYVFKLADLQADRDVVQIYNGTQQHLIATVMAIPAYRMKTPEKTIVTLEERKADSPEAIHDWFYPGDNTGFQFIYPKAQRLQVATNVKPLSPAPAPQPEAAAAPAPAPAQAPAVIEKQETVVMAQNQAPAAAENAAPAMPSELPKTAGTLPLSEALGATLLAGGVAVLGWARLRAEA